MRYPEYIIREERDLLYSDLLEVFNLMYNSMNKEEGLDFTSFIKRHKKLIKKSVLIGKGKYKTLELLTYYSKSYKVNRHQTIQNFMGMLNNRGLLNV